MLMYVDAMCFKINLVHTCSYISRYYYFFYFEYGRHLDIDYSLYNSSNIGIIIIPYHRVY